VHETVRNESEDEKAPEKSKEGSYIHEAVRRDRQDIIEEIRG